MAGLDKILEDIRAEGAKAVESVKSGAQATYDAEMEKARKDMEASIMDSIGVMMVRRQSKFIYYRNYQGFNTMTVVYE